MKPPPVRVVKLGGSLLEFDALVPALRGWLAAQSPAISILIAGGGPLADFIRQADARFSLGETAAHWMCTGAMSVSAKLLAALLPETELIADYANLLDSIDARRAANEQPGRLIVFDPDPFLRNHESTLPGHCLPQSWSVTSDSIAARLARVIGANELVLLKSSDPPAHAALASAAAMEYVDEFFPTAAREIPHVCLINLRTFNL